jgi:hypothetical protein
MPINKIAVSNGQLSVWHRFEVRQLLSGSSCVVKDKHALLSVSDTVTTAFLQLTAIWNKLGKTGFPSGLFFTRKTLAANPLTIQPLIDPSDIAVSGGDITVKLNYPEGKAPLSVTIDATPTTVGLSIIDTFPLAFDANIPGYPPTITLTGLTIGVEYAVKYTFNYDEGAGTLSSSTNVTP